MEIESREPESFKDCAACGMEWQTRQEFLEDPEITLVGYQAHFEELSAGLFLFNHCCGNTLALLIADFADFHSGSIFTEKKHNSDECPGYCLHEEDLQPCPIKCECSYIRDIMQMITRWPKREPQEE
ncbi:MAG TPA: hypothetical protein VKA68_15270 [bacterium]|nr:hypothetical protein [bacterium]